MSGNGMLPSIETFAKGVVATAAGLSTVGFGLLYYGQNYLIYPSAYPPGSRTDVDVPSKYDLPYEDLVLNTPGGINLRCYLLLQTKELSQMQAAHLDYEESQTDTEFASTRPTIIMFHGNGGNIGHRIPLAKVFYVKMRCNVLMLSYRGYGLSDGNPSEKGLCVDAQTALNYVTTDPTLSKTPIILYGQSIGGAVAIDLASRNPSKIAALILENTFTSLPSLIPTALPILSPFSFLCNQKWDSASKIPLIPTSMPILMLSGDQDQIVPKEHMHSLWELVAQRGERKTVGGKDLNEGLEKATFVSFEHGSHNDTVVQPGYWTAIADFIAKLGDA